MRSRSKKRWGRRDGLNLCLEKHFKGVDADLVLISRGAIDLIKAYSNNPINSAMDTILQAVKNMATSYKEKQSGWGIYCAKFKIQHVPTSFTITLNTRPIYGKTRLEFVIKANENYVGYRIDQFENMIATSAIDDILSEN